MNKSSTGCAKLNCTNLKLSENEYHVNFNTNKVSDDSLTVPSWLSFVIPFWNLYHYYCCGIWGNCHEVWLSEALNKVAEIYMLCVAGVWVTQKHAYKGHYGPCTHIVLDLFPRCCLSSRWLCLYTLFLSFCWNLSHS